MRKRDLLRFLPGPGKLIKALDHFEGESSRLAAENQHLRKLLHQVVFGSNASLVERSVPPGLETNGLSIPAAALRFLVAGTEDLEWFLHSGKLGVQTLTDILARQGQTLNHFKRILDFGCGCGRVTRHLKGQTGGEVHGSDCNARAIEWCQKQLPFAQFQVNGLEPPLPYPDKSFDLLYAFSVFTHLTEPLQTRWMAEVKRVLVPGGLAVITVHGDKCSEWLNPAELGEYKKGNLVMRAEEIAGTNYCNAFHPESYAHRVLFRDFEVLDFIPQGAKGNPPQDAYLLRLAS